MDFKIQPSKDVQLIFEIAVHYLMDVFDYGELQGISAIEQYYLDWKDRHKDDDFYHHLGPFEIALRVHYFLKIQGDELEYITWRRDNGLNLPRPVPESAQHLWQEFLNGE